MTITLFGQITTIILQFCDIALCPRRLVKIGLTGLLNDLVPINTFCENSLKLDIVNIA